MLWKSNLQKFSLAVIYLTVYHIAATEYVMQSPFCFYLFCLPFFLQDMPAPSHWAQACVSSIYREGKWRDTLHMLGKITGNTQPQAGAKGLAWTLDLVSYATSIATTKKRKKADNSKYNQA